MRKAKIIATDGSYIKNNAGYAIVTDNGIKLQSKVIGLQNSQNAEIQALHTAIELIKDTENDIIVISDSLSTVTSILSPNKLSNILIEDIKRFLKNNKHIILKWIKAHNQH